MLILPKSLVNFVIFLFKLELSIFVYLLVTTNSKKYWGALFVAFVYCKNKTIINLSSENQII